ALVIQNSTRDRSAGTTQVIGEFRVLDQDRTAIYVVDDTETLSDVRVECAACDCYLAAVVLDDGIVRSAVVVKQAGSDREDRARGISDCSQYASRCSDANIVQSERSRITDRASAGGWSVAVQER